MATNLIELANNLKMLPDQALMQELQHPSGAVPQYLLLSEMQRRQQMRSGAAAQQSQAAPSSVYQDAIRSMMARTPQPTPGVAPPPPGMTPVGNAPQQQPQPGSTPPQNFQPTPMAHGGRFDDGGAVSDDPDYLTALQRRALWNAGDLLPGMAAGGAAHFDDGGYNDDAPSLDDLLRQSAESYGLPPELPRAVARIESNYNPNARSKAGALGAMQIMPATFRQYGGSGDPMDPRNNIDVGTRILADLYNRYDGDYAKTLAAYNAGPGAVHKYGGVPPYKETQNYVRKGMALLKGAPQSNMDWAQNPIIHDMPAETEQEIAALTQDDGSSAPSSVVPGAPSEPSPAAGTAARSADDAPSGPNMTPAPSGLGALYTPVPASMSNPAPTPTAPPPAPPPAAAQPAVDTEALEKRYKLDTSRTEADRDLLRQMYQKYAGKPSIWQMLSNFGFGMAASKSPFLAQQIGAGGQAMMDFQQKQQDEARQALLGVLGVDEHLDERATQHQDALARIEATAANQAANRQSQDERQAAREKAASAGRQMKAQLTGRTVVKYQPATQAVPDGYEAVPDLESPGNVYLTTPAMMKLGSNLAKITGRDADEMVPYTEFKQLQQNYVKNQQKLTSWTPDQRMTALSLGVDLSNPNLSQDDAAKIRGVQHPSIELTPSQVQYWADALRQGAPMPNFGFGAAGAKARQQITAAAADGSHESFMASRGKGLSDTDSLKKITPQIDAIEAFENTANANLDLMLNTAKPLIDARSPWVNKPLRDVEKSGLGDAEVAAYDAARQVGLTELAKVTNNPNLSGQLSDTARKEVMSLIPEEASLSQIYHVTQVLKQDMANRKKSLLQQRGSIVDRLNTPTGGGAPAAKAAPMVGETKMHNGSTYRFDGQQWVLQRQ